MNIILYKKVFIDCQQAVDIWVGLIWAFQRWGQTDQDQGLGRGPDQDQEAVRESQDRGQEVVRESQVVHDLEVVQDKVALPEVDQVHYLNLFIDFFFHIERNRILRSPSCYSISGMNLDP